MPALATRMSRFVPSGIRRLMALSAEVEQAGSPVIHMEVGQPHFDTPAHIKDGVIEHLRGRPAGYTPNLGIPSLRAAVAARVAQRTGAEVTADNVCITSGAVMGLTLAILALVDPGDEVLIPDPGWPNYRSAVILAGGVPREYALSPENRFRIDVDDLAAAVGPRTKMIIVNTPSNPTGAVFDHDAMTALAELAERRGIYLLSDEVYEDITFGTPHRSVLDGGLRDRLLMVAGVSKSYAMTGWRIGWLVARPDIVSAAAMLVEPLTSCPSTLSQVAAEIAVTGSQECVAAMRDGYALSRSVVLDELGGEGILAAEPDGAIYALVDIGGTGQGSDEFALSLLQQQHVAVAPGSTFGSRSDRYIRLSTAVEAHQVREGCRRIVAHMAGGRRPGKETV